MFKTLHLLYNQRGESAEKAVTTLWNQLLHQQQEFLGKRPVRPLAVPSDTSEASRPKSAQDTGKVVAIDPKICAD